MRALVIAEHDGTVLKAATLNTVAAAAALGCEVDVLIAGAGAASGVAAAAARVSDVGRVLCADGEALVHRIAENVAAQVLALSQGYTHLIFAATAAGKNVAPRVAARLGVAQVSDATRIVNADTFERPIYAGNATATVQITDPVKVITVRTTAFPAALQQGSATIETVASVAADERIAWLGSEIQKQERPDLVDARIVVSGGRALGSRDQFNAVLSPLADKLGAAMGASRAAVDAGYAPNGWQVGQTGKIVAPDVYLAIGISGAIQHLAGMKDSRLIVAVNKDPEAPIFGIADYGLEADLFEAVPAIAAGL